MALKWTPLFSAPVHRYLELMCMAVVVCIEIVLDPIFAIITFLLICFGNIYLRAICICYVAFIYYDRHMGDKGGRGAGSKWMRSSFIWKYCRNYFPVDLVKTVDLLANRNYLLCAYPHGVLSLGVGVNCGTSHSQWSALLEEGWFETNKCSEVMDWVLPLVRQRNIYSTQFPVQHYKHILVAVLDDPRLSCSGGRIILVD